MLEVVGQAEVAAGNADVLEAQPAGRGGEEQELLEAGDGIGDHGGDGGGFLADLGEGAGGEAGPEEALDGVVEDVEGVGVLEEEGAGLVGAEGEVAAGEGVEEGDGEGGVGVGEDE